MGKVEGVVTAAPTEAGNADGNGLWLGERVGGFKGERAGESGGDACNEAGGSPPSGGFARRAAAGAMPAAASSANTAKCRDTKKRWRALNRTSAWIYEATVKM
eukprot:scaffold311695_cov27-Tisochrysis_lutea.AAC.1